jgi:hypothetical protein
VSLLARLAIYVPVLFLIALVVVGQHHANARDTLRAAIPRTLRWLLWSAMLVVVMLGLELVFIGW